MKREYLICKRKDGKLTRILRSAYDLMPEGKNGLVIVEQTESPLPAAVTDSVKKAGKRGAKPQN
jgi:hypothetical protein